MDDNSSSCTDDEALYLPRIFPCVTGQHPPLVSKLRPEIGLEKCLLSPYSVSW